MVEFEPLFELVVLDVWSEVDDGFAGAVLDELEELAGGTFTVTFELLELRPAGVVVEDELAGGGDTTRSWTVVVLRSMRVVVLTGGVTTGGETTTAGGPGLGAGTGTLLTTVSRRVSTGATATVSGSVCRVAK